MENETIEKKKENKEVQAQLLKPIFLLYKYLFPLAVLLWCI